MYPVVPSEFSNGRDEQRTTQQACVLFNQPYHMTDMCLEGPDGLKLLAKLGVNSFAKPTVERHVQTEIRAIVSPVPCSAVARTSYAEGWRTAQISR